MARLRTLKPSFFTNEDLVCLPMAARLLFAGLWCVADRRGRLEDRPLRIKFQLFPGDDLDIDDLLTKLQEKDLILRYEAEGGRYIQVVNFEKHQVPHIREAESTIPAPCEHSANTVPAPPVNLNGLLSSVNREPELVDTAADAATPVSDTERETDYPTPVRQSPQRRTPKAKPVESGQITAVFGEYQVRILPGARLTEDARRKIAARLRTWTADELIAGIEHFAADTWQMENNAHRAAGWFFATDTRVEQYINLQPRKGSRSQEDPASDPDRFINDDYYQYINSLNEADAKADAEAAAEEAMHASGR